MSERAIRAELKRRPYCPDYCLHRLVQWTICLYRDNIRRELTTSLQRPPATHRFGIRPALFDACGITGYRRLNRRDKTNDKTRSRERPVDRTLP